MSSETRFQGVADNGNGDEATASASLRILGSDEVPTSFPRIIEHPELKAVEKGRNVNLMCAVEGDPPPEVCRMLRLLEHDRRRYKEIFFYFESYRLVDSKNKIDCKKEKKRSRTGRWAVKLVEII